MGTVFVASSLHSFVLSELMFFAAIFNESVNKMKLGTYTTVRSIEACFMFAVEEIFPLYISPRVCKPLLNYFLISATPSSLRVLYHEISLIRDTFIRSTPCCRFDQILVLCYHWFFLASCTYFGWIISEIHRYKNYFEFSALNVNMISL